MVSSSQIRASFRDAAEHLVRLTEAVPADGWTKPGLGEWDVRSLVGHATRALLTVEQYLEAGASGEPEITSPEAYFLKLLAGAPDKRALNASVAERGREAGAGLGGNPAAAVRAVVARVLPNVDAAPDSALLPTTGGIMRLLDYLPTRVFELTVHSLDLAAALGWPAAPPKLGLAIALSLAAKLAAEQPLAGDLLQAMTGRRPLPAGYSIL